MKTACQQTPGICAGDAQCSDHHCPGHPCQHSRLTRAEERANAACDFVLYVLCGIAAVLCVGAVVL